MILRVGELQGVTEALNRIERNVNVRLRRVMELIGVRTIEYLKSLTTEVRPPATRGGGDRFAHPGHWADRSGHLANSYAWAVEEGPDGFTLRLTNSADYAIQLEQRDGFFVLSGVTDRGGPMQEALRQAVAEVAPSWQVIE